MKRQTQATMSEIRIERSNLIATAILSLVPVPLSEQELNAAFAFLASQDYREGVQTFLAKREPVFLGK